MSFLNNIKGTLRGVQHDISESFKNLRTKERKGSFEAKSSVDHVNIDAGADLLNRFQNKWAEIHDYSEDTANKAQEVDSLVTAFCDQYEHCHSMTHQLIMEVQAIPQLVEDIRGVMEKIGSLEVLFTDLEASLMQLEDSIEEGELAVNKREHLKQLTSYTKRRSMELEVTKVHLANEHAQKVENYESRLQAHIKERQEAFQEASTEELQQYKLTGQKPVIVESPKRLPAQRISLADIDLEEDTSDLDKFLGAGDSQDTPQTITGQIAIVADESSSDTEQADIEPSHKEEIGAATREDKVSSTTTSTADQQTTDTDHQGQKDNT